MILSPNLYAYTGGRDFDPSAPTVVFLHGGQHDHSVWILQSRYLAHHGYSVLALDLPGHMRGGGAPLTSIEAIADAIAPAIDACGTQRLLLTGHSMGSLVALELGERLASKVRGVALIATACPMMVANPLLVATREQPAEAMTMINVWSHSASIDAFTRKPANPGPGFSNVWGNLRLMQRIEQRNGAAVLNADFVACNAYRAGIERASALECPVLFVLGERDTMTPARNARSLIDACRDRTVITLPGAGHSLMAEHPDGVRDALVDFAQRVFAVAAKP
jgi:pimeloyl-ACP methyl ester carboxylesterase